MPTGIMPVEVDPGVFFCQKCFRDQQQTVNAFDFADSPNKVVKRRRGKGFVLIR